MGYCLAAYINGNAFANLITRCTLAVCSGRAMGGA